MEGVYLVQVENTQHFKIGKTSDINGRLKGLQTSNAGKVFLIKLFECRDCSVLEKRLHNIFKKNKMEGEWFNFTDDDLNNCITEAHHLVKDIHTKLDKNTCHICKYSAYRNETFKDHTESLAHKKAYGIKFPTIENEYIANILCVEKPIPTNKKNIRIIKNKKSYTCKRCKKIYVNKYDYNRHINRKIPCELLISDENEKNNLVKLKPIQIPTENIVALIQKGPENVQQIKKTGFDCEYCFTAFTRKDSLDRHLDSRCKERQAHDTTIKKKNDINQFFEKFDDLTGKFMILQNRFNKIENENKELKEIMLNFIKSNDKQITPHQTEP
jgi:hypothetical protein